MTVSILLKSCATPPARRPTASIFCARSNCSSRVLRTLISLMKAMLKVPSSVSTALRATSTGNSAPSLRRPERSSPIPDLSGRRKDGAEFPVEVALSAVETEEGTFSIAFISDISVRKTLEEQLLRAQKMEAVGRLAGGVAHDFNNMLTVIAGYNRMILDELSTVDPLRGYAEEILKAADRAAALTNQLLAFSRRQIMQPRIINLNAVIGQTENMLRRLIGEDIQLVMSLGADTGNIRTDPHHIEQAIVNLAVNARDAMPAGGRIIIETSNVQIDETYAKTHMGVM